jgi:hypothetical protein
MNASEASGSNGESWRVVVIVVIFERANFLKLFVVSEHLRDSLDCLRSIHTIENATEVKLRWMLGNSSQKFAKAALVK